MVEKAVSAAILSNLINSSARMIDNQIAKRLIATNFFAVGV
jgi:hypothetical protein